MDELVAVTKALADESRIRLLRALEGGERCVCQLVELLELAPSTVSKHLALLRQAGLVEARKEGRWIHYRRADEGASPTRRRALALVRAALAGDGQAARDDARLTEILALDPDALCRRQRGEPEARPRERVPPETARGSR